MSTQNGVVAGTYLGHSVHLPGRFVARSPRETARATNPGVWVLRRLFGTILFVMFNEHYLNVVAGRADDGDDAAPAPAAGARGA